ncbi:MAG: HAD family phosphatase [Proteobacteria bacterium]|nr:HAD family phosphatase [Pseudomonadota bacterium]
METLVTDPFRHVMPRFFGLSLPQLLAAKNQHAWIAFEKGLSSEETYLRGFFQDGRSFDHDAFRARVRASYEWLPGMRELLAELRARGRAMYALSNYPVWYTWIEERLGMSKYVQWDFVSCRTGLRKPDRRAYLNAAACIGREPCECLFVDDRSDNCDAARTLAMDALLFKDSGSLRVELKARNLL